MFGTFLRKTTLKFSRPAVGRFSSYERQKTASYAVPVIASCFVAIGILATASPTENAGFFSSTPDYVKIKQEIAKAIEAEDEKRGDGTSIAPTIVRLAWHASGTYSKFSNTGGSNGATMRFAPESEWGANAGLAETRKFLETIAKKHGISQADCWTLAGATAIEQMGGPLISWKAGRTDATKGSTEPDGRLPNADMGCPRATSGHIRDIFGKMGFDDREIVALSGAHAVGRCHTNASGYWGPWTFAESTFSNEYFRLLLEEKWSVKKTHEGKPWTGPMQYEDPSGAIMMLPSDLVLVQDEKFKKYVEMYAKDETLFFKDFASAFAKLMNLGC